MFEVFVIIALIALIGFRSWLEHSRRAMIHRERMLALEKGIALPDIEHEVRRRKWNVQRIIVLAGFSWISVALGLFVLLRVIAGKVVQVPWEPLGVTMTMPPGTEWTAIAPLGVGLAHLLVYLMDRSKEL